jgi:hypothetical protein
MAEQRDALAAEVTIMGFDASKCTCTRFYGSHDTTAALLILPLSGPEPHSSPRVLGELGARGTFTVTLRVRRPAPASRELSCRARSGSSKALATTGRVHEAAELFEQLLALASPAGLYGGEMGPSTHLHPYAAPILMGLLGPVRSRLRGVA